MRTEVATQAADGRKNIKIAQKDIFSFEFFAPFNSLFLEPESISAHLAEISLRFYNILFPLFSVS